MSEAILENEEQTTTINKTDIKEFATSARKKLIERVEMQALRMGFDKNTLEPKFEFEDDNEVKINGHIFNKKQVNDLSKNFKDKGFDTVIDEVAYTWFNRFIALYFMEVHNYIDNGLNVVSSLEDINNVALKAPMYFTKLNKEELFKLVQDNKTEEVYKMLVVAQCNELSSKLPFLFEEINDYSETLFPAGILNNDSVIRDMLALDKSNWKEVEIIGWLYQYYIAERKDEVFANLKKGKKISKEDVPAATQIFTPKWIVKYMVENSVGKMWLEAHPNTELQSKFKYYLESAEQEDDVKQKLNEIIDKNLTPENIKVLDPACGSGHILVTAFTVLYEIYKSAGYIEEEIPELILRKNLYGLDICNRASQLAQLAVMMMAREYDKNIFDKNIELNITAIQDSNWVDSRVKECLMNGEDNKLLAQNQIELLQDTFRDAKEYGSIIDVKDFDFDFWNEKIASINTLNVGLLNSDVIEDIQNKLPPLIKQAKIMQQKYESVISNPPYMGNKGMSAKLSEYVKKNFKNTKTDFFSVFMEKNYYYTVNTGYISMITQPSWLFLSSFEELRKQILNNQCIISVLHMGRGIFGIDFGSCAFTFRKVNIKNYMGSYFRLHQRTFQFINPNDIENLYLTSKDNHDFEFNFSTYKANNNGEELEDENTASKPLKIYFEAKQNGFHSIPGSPIVYWVSENFIGSFQKGISIDSFSDFTGSQHITADNERFLRFHWEVNNQDIGKGKSWAFYSKGGEYRKWYGNLDYIVDIKLPTLEFYKSNKTSNLLDEKYWFKDGISYSAITSKGASFREYPAIGAFDKGGPVICDVKNKNYFLGFFNSNLANNIFKILNPTVNLQVNDVKNLPILFPMEQSPKYEIEKLVEENIEISKDDWDSFETSWDFEMHPLLRFSNINKGLVDSRNMNVAESITLGDKVKDCFNKWKAYKQEQFNKLKANEEELNRLFIEIYGLQDEMTPDVDDKDITVALADETRDIKSLMSYAVGCMLGRYSLDEKGLAFAGGEFDSSKYKSLDVDEDAILPVLSDTWFEDDIVEEFKRFLKKAFGELYFNENMQYIASVLSGKSCDNPEKVIRNYYLKDFYKDHLQIYKKRPIYWMFTSGKEKAFNCLVYLHRYDKTTLSRIRKDYLHKLQAKLDSAIIRAEEAGDVKLSTQYTKDKKELLDFDAKIKDYADEQIELDLDDGVKVNYAKFRGLLEAEKDIIGKEKK